MIQRHRKKTEQTHEQFGDTYIKNVNVNMLFVFQKKLTLKLTSIFFFNVDCCSIHINGYIKKCFCVERFSTVP